MIVASYPGFSATYKAMGATSLALGDTHKAVQLAEKAVSINRNDPKALLLLSISDFAILNKDTALKYFREAITVEPQGTMGSWEIEYVIEKEPNPSSPKLAELGRLAGTETPPHAGKSMEIKRNCVVVTHT